MSVVTGVDLSHWNKIVSYSKLAAATGFVVLKATEGTGYIDPTFVDRMGKLRKAGARVGSYHFATGSDPTAEAAHYVKVARPRPGELVMLDVEAGILKRPDLVGWCVAWIKAVRAATGILPVIYMSSSVVTAHNWSQVAKLGVRLWAARYSNTPPAAGAFGSWSIWQHSSSGRLAGVAGNVDMNRLGKGVTWAQLTKHATPKPAPKPAPAAPAPVKAPKTSYTVKAGDTLAGIARRHGTTWRRLVAWNKDRYPQLTGNPNLIEVGWKLVVAAGATPPNKTVTVKAGDTLSGIAAAKKTTVRALVELNHSRYPSLVRDPGLIHPGWELYLP